MNISKDVFKIMTPNVTNAHNIITGTLRLMKDVLLAQEKYLKFCNDILPYLERPEEAMLMASRIQKKYYQTKDKIETKDASQEDLLEMSNHNYRH